MESGMVLGALAVLLAGQRRFAESLDCLDRFQALSPLLDREGRRWLAARRSDALYELGDLEGARRQATLAENPFHAALADRLTRPAEDGRRVLLGVPFVRQHHKTCTPASLASVASFWSRPVDHLALAETICYDGTPRHRARAWAEADGWVVHEFRVTWESACALLDRGIPFVLAIAGPMFGHDQAVVGYDARRGTLYVREPSGPFLVEVLAAPFLDAQRWSGPRGFVLLPRAEHERLAGVELPDAWAYERLHQIQMSLEAHRPDAAEALQREMEGTLPDHPLTLWAAALVAGSAADEATQVQCIEGLLRRFPDCAALLFRKLSLLQGVAPPRELRRLLDQGGDRHPRDVPLLSLRAHVLSLDAREHPRALRALRAVLRMGISPTTGHDLLSLARIEEARGRPEAALELYRFSACFEDMNESFAATYFSAGRARNRTDEALALLRRRFERLAPRSGHPGMTLSWALEQCGYVPQALDALERALALRPADGELMLLAADAHARHQRLERAESLLSAAYHRSPLEAWLRTAARAAFAHVTVTQEAPPPGEPRPPIQPEPAWPAALGPLFFLLLLQMLGSRRCSFEEVAADPLSLQLLLVAGLCVLLVGGSITAWLTWRQRRATPLKLGLEPVNRRHGEGYGTARGGLPSRVGRYRILGVLARGAEVVVYHARDETWEREVALEVARDPVTADATRARLLHEAEVVSSLHHPHIPTVYEVGEFQGMPYLASELLAQGMLLTQVSGVRVGLHSAVAIAVQALSGLQHAHERGIVHLDVNPATIFVGFDGSVKILGFGSAPAGNPAARSPGGTPYLSPEQVCGADVDARSDLFSVGLVLRELVTGARARRGGDPTTGAKEEWETDFIWKGLPQGPQWGRLRAVIARALKKEPADRYPDAPSFSADLLDLLEVPHAATP
jgi:tetratricopeptide (TPR) repeat protein